MDPLDHLVGGSATASGSIVAPLARGAFALRVVMGGEWSIDVDDDAALSVLVVLTGGAVLTRAGGETALEPGDVVLLPRGARYTVADAPGSPPLVRILPGQVCSGIDGVDLALDFARGVRSWGNADIGDTTMLLGAYESASAVGALALASLPPVAHVSAGLGLAPVVDVLTEEMERDDIGQQTVIDRLLDVLVVKAVRAFIDNASARPAGWTGAIGDPAVEHTLRLIHDAPERRWTIEQLARSVHVSRATLAARFRRRVGMPPMAYLSEWRLSLACEGLDRGASVGEIASELGYASPFSFSAAFRRHHGMSPSEYRRREIRTS